MLVVLECALFLLLLGGIIGVLSLTGDDLEGPYIRRFGWREGRFRLKTPAEPPQAPDRSPELGNRGGAESSIIGSDLVITGNLESKGEVQIDGEVEGDVHAARIVVGKQGRITGTLTADAVVVGGSVQGSIRCKSLALQSGSRVEADIFHKSLTMEMGAAFEGKSRRSEDPMSVARDPNACRFSRSTR